MIIKPHDYCRKKKPTTADFCHYSYILVFERWCIRQTRLGASDPNTTPNQKAATSTQNGENGYVCSF